MRGSSDRDYRYTILFGFCFLFLLVTRFLFLAEKPYHHDESLYATESWRYATQGRYAFNPMFHGPFLFHLQAALFKILPINDFVGRLPIALAGTGLALFAFGFASRTGLLSAVVWLALISFSPVFCFFSRFLGMDVLMTCIATGLLLFSLRAWEKRSATYLYLAALCMISLICIKLNWLFYVFSFGTFFLVRPYWSEETYGSSLGKGVDATTSFIKAFRYHWIIIGVLVVAFYVLLNSSLWTNPGGVLDALYRKMIPYWINQHKIERVGGPFHYYFPLLAVYELPLLVGICWSVVHILRSSWASRRLFLRWVIACTLLYATLIITWGWVGPMLKEVLHFKAPFHAPLLVLEIGLWALLMRHHLKKDELLAAFSAHWGITSLILYSMAGEKVPWLATHVLLPWYFYFAIVIPPLAMRWMRQPASRFALGVILISVFTWQGVITVRSSFPMAADPQERLVFTHTTEEIQDLVARIQHVSKTTGEGLDFHVQVTGNSVWPIQWYLRDFKQWFWPKITPEKNPKVVVQDWEKRDEVRKMLGNRFQMERVKLRAWWVPDPAKVSFSGLVKYYFTREVYSPTGSSDLCVFVRNDIFEEWRAYSPRAPEPPPS